MNVLERAWARVHSVAYVGIAYFLIGLFLTPPYMFADLSWLWSALFCALVAPTCVWAALKPGATANALAAGLVTGAALSRAVALLLDPNAPLAPVLVWTYVAGLQFLAWPMLTGRAER